MAIAELLVGNVILPRTESPQAVSRLAEFEWFHKIETENETITPELDDLLLRSQKIYQTIEYVVKGLNVPPIVGMMEILFKGTQIKQKKYELKELESMIEDVEKKTPLVVGDATKLLEEDTNTRKSLEEYTSLKETLQLIKKLDIDIGNFGLMKYFFTNFFVIKTSDYDEIVRTLEEVVIYKYELESKVNSAFVIIYDTKYADKVTMVI